MITINTYPKIQTSYDMIPVNNWLQHNITGKFEWRVSKEWHPGWGHPMLLDFDNEDDAVLFVLTWL